MKVLTPIKAIRAKCLDCCVGQFIEVKMCTCETCPLSIQIGTQTKEGY